MKMQKGSFRHTTTAFFHTCSCFFPIVLSLSAFIAVPLKKASGDKIQSLLLAFSM